MEANIRYSCFLKKCEKIQKFSLIYPFKAYFGRFLEIKISTWNSASPLGSVIYAKYVFSQGTAIPIPINDHWDETVTQ
ncbi:MAG TPA: hypothetical protein DIU00_13030 [Phycisphaerales bacterium]|nr:hypothetical protein [Phycisphaerales bacterium]